MMTIARLISPAYLAQQRELHARPNGYGAKGGKWAETVLALAVHTASMSVLDYGCGQGGLVRRLKPTADAQRIPLRLAEYDPAVAGKDHPPLFADLVVVTDVLEHIEPDRLDAVLAHLQQLARKAVFFVVALDPANKVLADGRNAHLILESREWWAARVTAAGFRLSDLPVALPPHYSAEKRAKRWIAVGEPC